MPGLDEQKKAQEKLLKRSEEDFADSILGQLKDQKAEPSFHRPDGWPQKEES